MHTPPREHRIGRLATSSTRRLPGRDRFLELIGHTRRQLEHELTELDAQLETARLERAAAEHRYRHQVAIVDSRRAEIRRRLSSL
jgi:hypothetical protein